MQAFGLLSYLSAGLLFLLLTVLSAVSWKGGRTGLAFIAVAALSSAWALLLAYHSSRGDSPGFDVVAMEFARTAAWIVFLLVVIGNRLALWIRISAYLLLGAAAIHVAISGLRPDQGFAGTLDVQSLLLAAAGLVLLEQVQRSSKRDAPGRISYLTLGLGAILTFDLALFAQVTIVGVQPLFWNARGLVNALAVPLLSLAARRTPEWSLDIFISRHAVFYSTTFFAATLYCVAMAFVAYLIGQVADEWGLLLEALFILLAAAVLVTLIYAERATGRIKVFLSKHFYRNKYEYRDEWLRLIRTLSSDSQGESVRARAVRAVAEIVGAIRGGLWERQDDGDFQPTAAWNTRPGDSTVKGEHEFVEFLRHRRWIVDTRELSATPDVYSGLTLPPGVVGRGRYLIVPLFQESALKGFVTLQIERASFSMNYEDYDLLLTVGQQIASWLAEEDAKERLARARQFETFNQLSAFLMHDLRNVIAQQSLLVRNAARHKHDPAFMEDTIRTIENSVQRMQNLVNQLTHRGVSSATKLVDLNALADKVVKDCAGRVPAPVLAGSAVPVAVNVDAERLSMVLQHLVRNAQDATPASGTVRVEIETVHGRAVIRVVDSGIGMDADFIRNRLFRPFDTTKGSQGMGIGAYQARELVRRFSGRLSVSSEVGVGTTVTIELPLGESVPLEPIPGAKRTSA